MPTSRLGTFQKTVLEAFFRREKRFFLTGGAALAGYHLGHRETEDLDLFTTEAVLDEGERVLAEVAEELGATLERVQTSPDFRRRLLSGETESVLVDLVLDRVADPALERLVVGEVRMDPPEEILAAKLGTLLSRAEIRDVVDVMALEEAGFPVESAFERATARDASLTPAQLAWVLSQISLGPDARVPGDRTRDEVVAFLERLQQRLTSLAFPRSDPE